MAKTRALEPDSWVYYEGKQNTYPQNRPFGHIDYFELKTIKKNLSLFLNYLKEFR